MKYFVFCDEIMIEEFGREDLALTYIEEQIDADPGKLSVIDFKLVYGEEKELIALSKVKTA